MANNAITPEAVSGSLERVVFGLAQQGFTSAHDAGSGFCMVPGLAAGRMMDAAGKFPLRLEASYMTMPDASNADNVRRLREMHERFGSPDVDAAPGAKKHKPHAHVVEALGGAGAAAVVAGHAHSHAGDHSGVRSSKVSVNYMKVRLPPPRVIVIA